MVPAVPAENGLEGSVGAAPAFVVFALLSVVEEVERPASQGGDEGAGRQAVDQRVHGSHGRSGNENARGCRTRGRNSCR